MEQGSGTLDPLTFDSLPPEVKEMVASFVDQGDLAACARVSQDWHVLFNPHVWRHIQGESGNTWNQTFWDCCNSENALKTNGHHVQLLKLYFESDSYKYFERDQESDFFDVSPPSFPRLTSVTFYGMRGRGDLVAQIIRMGSEVGLRELTFIMFEEREQNWLVAYSDDMVKAILRQAPTLEVLNLDGGSYLKSKDINKLLCSAPNLRELHLLGDTRPEFGENPCLDANDVVQSEWVCTNLEIFGCAIGRIPRHDITRRMSDGSYFTCAGSYRDGIDLQRGVYSQMSRLTKLRELYLGSPMKEYEEELEPDDEFPRQDSPSRQFDCLAMSLDSGLDKLKNLKNLHTIELKDMEVYIDGPLEQKWIAENWPKVKQVVIT